MKVFCVSKACNACGECILRTPLLMENEKGYAVPDPKGYIKETEIADAELIVSKCPVQALTIIEKESVKQTGTEGLQVLSNKLKKRLSAITVPEVKQKDIEYDEKKYRVRHGYIHGENSTRYPSSHKAEEAGKEQFESVFWNQRKAFVVDILTQYKHKVLRKYYDLSASDQTVYSKVSKKIEQILKESIAEANAFTSQNLPFPEDFSEFHPELVDSRFERLLKEGYENVVTNYYVTRFCEELEKEDGYRKKDYLDSIISDSEEITDFVQNWRGKYVEKRKSVYTFRGAADAGERMIDNILFYLGYPKCCGLLSLDEVYAENLRFIMGEYQKLVSEEIKNKVEIYKKVIGLMK